AGRRSWPPDCPAARVARLPKGARRVHGSRAPDRPKSNPSGPWRRAAPRGERPLAKPGRWGWAGRRRPRAPPRPCPDRWLRRGSKGLQVGLDGGTVVGRKVLHVAHFALGIREEVVERAVATVVIIGCGQADPDERRCVELLRPIAIGLAPDVLRLGTIHR